MYIAISLCDVHTGAARTTETQCSARSVRSADPLTLRMCHPQLLGVTALSLLITPVLMNISIALIGNDTGGVLMQKINIEAGHMGMAWTKEPQYRGDQPGAVEMMPISPPSSPMHSPRRHHRASCLGFTGRQRKRANAENDVPAAKSSNGEP